MKQNGFTLIELMITIVIIAILAGIAVPQYLAYTRRAEVAELVALADIVKKCKSSKDMEQSDLQIKRDI